MLENVVKIIQDNMTAILPLFLELFCLLFVVLLDPYIKRSHRRIMLISIALITLSVVQNLLNDYFGFYYNNPTLRTLNSIFGYSVSPVIIVLFCMLVSDKTKQLPLWIVTGVNALIHSTSLFSHVCFWISDDNHFRRGPLTYTSHVVCAGLLLYLLYLTLKRKSDRKSSRLFIPVFNILSVVAAFLLDTFVTHTDEGVTFTTIATVNSCLFYYIWLHLEFVHDHEKALMAEQRIKIMMSQIQPHFLYNTLSSIQALCLADPEKAFDVTEKLGTYLRQNIDSLDQPQLIPFEKELEHTRVYSEIEMIRFPSIRIEYDTRDTDFSIPALTVQPLVENAIRHGIRGVENGIVCVSSKKAGDFYEIMISDNGRGFDVQAAENASGTHIGLHNVKERIEEMCGGTLTIESITGAGTTITIRIPTDKE